MTEEETRETVAFWEEQERWHRAMAESCRNHAAKWRARAMTAEPEHNHFGEVFMPNTCPACARLSSSGPTATTAPREPDAPPSPRKP